MHWALSCDSVDESKLILSSIPLHILWAVTFVSFSSSNSQTQWSVAGRFLLTLCCVLWVGSSWLYLCSALPPGAKQLHKSCNKQCSWHTNKKGQHFPTTLYPWIKKDERKEQVGYQPDRAQWLLTCWGTHVTTAKAKGALSIACCAFYSAWCCHSRELSKFCCCINRHS